MSLKEYARKRNFRKTAEPIAGKPQSALSSSFVIQKHEASRLHYDFRLEMDGVLKSWAVPKGLPFKRGEKHLAVQVEDHPLAYANFEGIIPKGQYGGGTVMVWDYGTYEPLSTTPVEDLKNGKIHIVLHGKKMKGEWHLVRFRKEENQWLIIRGGADMKTISKKADDMSALSGKTMKALSQSERVWQSKPNGNRGELNSLSNRRESLPPFVEPMKARLVTSVPAGEWIYEIKFDGWRALALKAGRHGRLLSRNEKDLSLKFPEIVKAISQLNAGEAVLDGEIVALDEKGRSSFQLLQAYDIGSRRPPIYYYVFDLLRLNGRDLKKLPVIKRKSELEKLLADHSELIRYSATLGKDGNLLLKKARTLGLEGLIGKRINSPYEAGRRSGAWIKLKFHLEQEFVIGGYTDPTGSRPFFGSLIIGVYEGKELIFTGKVGSGFSSKLLRSLAAKFKKIASDSCPFSNLPMPRDSRWGQALTTAEMKRCHWIMPELVCQIKFAGWTRDKRLRQPVFLGLREDKDPHDVKQEIATP